MSALDDFLSYAEGEVDYHENADGSSKDGAYFGNSEPAEWCTYFVCWCADKAGILTTASEAGVPYIPRNFRVTGIVKFYQDNRRSLEPKSNPSSGNYPQPGDLVSIENDWEEPEDHIGIVYEVDGNKLTTIEGNYSNSVKKVTYTDFERSDAKIVRLLSNHTSW